MLVLSRKKEQAIVINGDIKVRVLKIQGNTVRIGIEASDDHTILRGELADWHELSFDEAFGQEAVVAV